MKNRLSKTEIVAVVVAMLFFVSALIALWSPEDRPTSPPPTALGTTQTPNAPGKPQL